jgi:hypothetical protein
MNKQNRWAAFQVWECPHGHGTRAELLENKTLMNPGGEECCGLCHVPLVLASTKTTEVTDSQGAFTNLTGHLVITS